MSKVIRPFLREALAGAPGGPPAPHRLSRHRAGGGPGGGAGHSHTFCVHSLFHDDLHPLHVVPVPEAIQSLAVLVSERQDLGHGLAGKDTGCAAGSSRTQES